MILRIILSISLENKLGGFFMQFKFNKSMVFVCLIVALILVVGCSNNNNKTSSNNNEPQQTAVTNKDAGNDTETDKGTRELTDPLGHKITIPSQPQHIIASYLEDYLVALGVKPAAQWAIGDSPMLYLQSELKDIPFISYDLPYEAVTSFEPDLILIGDESLIADDKYDTYNKIAPTYALGSEINADWRQALLKIGEVLNKGTEAEQVLQQYEAKASEAKAAIAASSEEAPSAAAIWLVGGTFWIVVDHESSGSVMYEDLGLKVPAIVSSISEGEGGIWRSLSMEALAELDADHIFLVNSDTATGSEALNDPIWKSLPAVVNGNVHEYGPDSSWLYTGPIANNQMVDDVLESVVK